MRKRKVILDVDPGVDDAAALTMALFDERLEVVAVTAVGGNVPAEQATRNVQTIIEQLDPPRWPRIGAARMTQVAAEVDGRATHGSNGLGGVEFPTAGLANIHPAEKVIADEIRAAPGQVSVLCLGPLTNLAKVFAGDVDLVEQVDRVVIMGGADRGSGSITAAAEFNFYYDPPAARYVLHQQANHTIVPIDVTRQVEFGFSLLEELPPASTRGGQVPRATFAAVLPRLSASIRRGSHSFTRRRGADGLYQP